MNHLSLYISTYGLFNPDLILSPLYYNNGVNNTVSKGNITLLYSLCGDKYLNVSDDY